MVLTGFNWFMANMSDKINGFVKISIIIEFYDKKHEK